MVGPEDAGAQGGAALLPSGREEEEAETAAAEDDDDDDAEADGERDGSREGSGARLQRYLAGKRPPNGDACGAGRMTNGDAGFLLLPPSQEGPPPSCEEPATSGRREDKLLNGGCAFFLTGSQSGVALEEPLKSCSLAGTAATSAAMSPSPSCSSSSGSPSPASEEAGSLSSPARALPCLPSLAFMDINLNSRNTFEVSRRRSAPEHLQPQQSQQPPTLASTDSASAATACPEDGDRAKRLGIIAGSSFAEFFTRNFFTKRTKELKPTVHSAPGWKLFGKVPPKENLQKDSKIIQQDESSGSVESVSTLNLLNTVEYEARTGKVCKPAPQATRRRYFEFEPLSTTALILEDRPSNLPAKSVEEALRHRQEYDEMVAEAKKRGTHTSSLHLGQQSMQRILHEFKFHPYKLQNSIPMTTCCINSFVNNSWLNNVLISVDAGVSIADREASLELIKLDISRTFPSLYIFQKGGPYHDLLHSVLGAYTCYRPDVGYVQGMSFIAAVLILNLEEADAFIAFANLLNKPCQLAFFRVDHSMMLKYFAAFEVFFEENLPKLFHHFKSYNLTPDIYLIDWIFTLYSKSLPLDLACRVWDVFCRDGEEFLFRTGLGILRLYEDILLQMDFIHIAQFLTKLPEDITSEKLFTCITSVQMQNSNKKWAQVFASLMKDNKEGDKNHSPALKS
ncbi:TBC1 domain family member 12 [Varanus komodoensis]|uniref:TBC1 domain family member 12 n=1 Tax=Varanus komodoensis TaxID=61221 RepID=UPI001CF7CFEC|nr:TBC1 domain family member 12 [Varanus komodoensis]